MGTKKSAKKKGEKHKKVQHSTKNSDKIKKSTLIKTENMHKVLSIYWVE